MDTRGGTFVKRLCSLRIVATNNIEENLSVILSYKLILYKYWAHIIGATLLIYYYTTSYSFYIDEGGDRINNNSAAFSLALLLFLLGNFMLSGINLIEKGQSFLDRSVGVVIIDVSIEE